MDIFIRQQIADLASRRLRTVPGHGDFTYRAETIGVSIDVADVTYCSQDTATLFDIQDLANPDDDVAVDVGVLWTRSVRHLVLSAGAWRVTDGHEVESSREVDLCAR